MKKIIGITGGNGMLGSDLKLIAEKNGFKTILFDLPEFDITNDTSLQTIVDKSDIIVNCAAYTAVDKAEEEYDTAFAINATAVANLAKKVEKANKYLIHISTDFVFGDKVDTPLNEKSEPNPLSVYGKTKLEGEKLLAKTKCKHAIIRVEWTFGKNGNNFISKIAELATSRDELKVVADQVGSPTPTTEVAKAILSFIKNKTEGLYHFSSNGYATRFDVAELIVKYLSLKTTLTPCKTKDFQTPAQRPLNSKFDCSKIDSVLDFKRVDWKDAIKNYLTKN